jgi:hypothetical protein
VPFDWPDAWDQGAWGTATGALGLASAIWAAVASSLTRRRVREALEAQRIQRVRQHLVSTAEEVEGWAQQLGQTINADDREGTVVLLQTWPVLLGEVEGLLSDAPFLTQLLLGEVQTALSEVDAKVDLAEDILMERGRTTYEATRRLRRSVKNLRRLLRRIVSESRGETST